MITTLLSLGLSSMLCVSPVFAEDINTIAWYDTYAKVPSLGNYEFEIESHEIPSHEVLPIVGKEYFPYSTMKYTTEVDNTAPSAKYKAMPISKVDVVFALGKLNQSEQLTSYISTFTSKLGSSGNAIDARVEQIETSKVDMQHAFNWHSDVGYNIGSIAITNSGRTVVMKGNPSLMGKNAVYIASSAQGQRKVFSFDYNIEFGDSFGSAGVLFNIKQVGNYLEGYAISFTRGARTTLAKPRNWDAWEAVVGQQYNHLVQVYREHTHWLTGEKHRTWVNASNVSYPAQRYIQEHDIRTQAGVGVYKIRYRLYDNANTFWDISGRQGYNNKYILRSDDYKSYAYSDLPYKYQNGLALSGTDLQDALAYGVRVQDVFVEYAGDNWWGDCPNVQYIGDIPAQNQGRLTLDISSDTLIVSGGGMTDPVQIDLPEEMGSGLGFYAEHYSHGCDSIGEFTLDNMELITTNTKSLGKAVQDVYWRDNATRVIVYADDSIPGYLEDETSKGYQTTLTKLMNNGVYLVGLGNDENRQVMNDLITNISTTDEVKGTYFKNTPVNIGLDNACNWIIELIKNLAKPEDWILVNTEVLWDTIYKDQEHDLPFNFGEHDGTQAQPQDTSDVELANAYGIALTHLYKSDKILAEKWRYRHFNNYFDNSTVREGFHSIWLENPVEIFPNPGLYRINYKRKDNPFYDNVSPSYIFDNYRYWSTDYDYKQSSSA